MSQYYTPYSLDDDSAKFQTISTNGSSVQSTAITARRILITTGSQTTFVEFGANPTASAVDFVVPANSQMIFNFKTGNKVAVYTASQSYTSITDLD